jgi:hypothetical protein
VELNPITHLRRPEPKTWSTSEKKKPRTKRREWDCLKVREPTHNGPRLKKLPGQGGRRWGIIGMSGNPCANGPDTDIEGNGQRSSSA